MINKPVLLLTFMGIVVIAANCFANDRMVPIERLDSRSECCPLPVIVKKPNSDTK